MKTSQSIDSRRFHLSRYWLLALPLFALTLFASTSQAAECPQLLQHRFANLQTGESQNLCQYQGKVILVVNTASYCGYTDQYGGLEALYRKYKDQGLVVLGFPSNDFGNQEPGDSKQIAKFCRLTYSVEFPMFEKSHVTGKQRSALFAKLDQQTGQRPQWNFHKYLIDASGKKAQSFASAVAPDDPRLLESVRKLLDARKALLRKT